MLNAATATPARPALAVRRAPPAHAGDASTPSATGFSQDHYVGAAPWAGAPAAGDRHAVRAGESLSTIARRHTGDAGRWRELYEANKDLVGADPNKLRAGTKLRLPASFAPVAAVAKAPAAEKVTVTVKPGDTLTGIAHATTGKASSFDEIHDANRPVIGPDPDLIHPDQVLEIPESLHQDVLETIARGFAAAEAVIDAGCAAMPRPGETVGEALLKCEATHAAMREALDQLQGSPTRAAYEAKVQAYAEALNACRCLS